VKLWKHGEATIVQANDPISDYRVYTDIAPVLGRLPTVAAPPVS
jgi:hypothetical protein